MSDCVLQQSLLILVVRVPGLLQNLHQSSELMSAAWSPCPRVMQGYGGVPRLVHPNEALLLARPTPSLNLVAAAAPEHDCSHGHCSEQPRSVDCVTVAAAAAAGQRSVKRICSCWMGGMGISDRVWVG